MQEYWHSSPLIVPRRGALCTNSVVRHVGHGDDPWQSVEVTTSVGLWRGTEVPYWGVAVRVCGLSPRTKACNLGGGALPFRVPAHPCKETVAAAERPRPPGRKHSQDIGQCSARAGHDF